MSFYSIALFLHVVGAVLLFVLLTIEGLGLQRGFATASMNRVLGPISAAAIFIPGLYMTATTWGFIPWIVVGIATYVAIAAVGAITGVSVLRGRMGRDAAILSWLARVGLALGVVFDMTVKPGGLVAVAAVLAGLVVGAGAARYRRQVKAA
ncbi:MAG TPA: hypothetical protein VJQ08_10375 [Candidatus Dormibacteraeota bacterium]|nr:hypothetical protein [Candidatus Dormibacteraeota bacterium]